MPILRLVHGRVSFNAVRPDLSHEPSLWQRARSNACCLGTIGLGHPSVAESPEMHAGVLEARGATRGCNSSRPPKNSRTKPSALQRSVAVTPGPRNHQRDQEAGGVRTATNKRVVAAASSASL